MRSLYFIVRHKFVFSEILVTFLSLESWDNITLKLMVYWARLKAGKSSVFSMWVSGAQILRHLPLLSGALAGFCVESEEFATQSGAQRDARITGGGLIVWLFSVCEDSICDTDVVMTKCYS